MKAYKPFTSVTAIAMGLLLSMNTFAQKLPYQDPKLTSEKRAQDLISRLTLEEKALLMQDQSPAISRLGINKFSWWSEALHGLANNNNVTVFPEPIGMAASFDDSLVYKIFHATSDETRAKYSDVNGPLKTLRGFKRINVAAGRTNESIINLPYSAFEFYDETKLQMTVAPGEFETWYGNSSAKKDLKMIKIMIK